MTKAAAAAWMNTTVPLRLRESAASFDGVTT